MSKRYGRRVGARRTCRSTLRPGEITLLLGANGAGKSTLLRCLLGITDFEGTIRVAGLDPLRDGRAVRRSSATCRRAAACTATSPSTTRCACMRRSGARRAIAARRCSRRRASADIAHDAGRRSVRRHAAAPRLRARALHRSAHPGARRTEREPRRRRAARGWPARLRACADEGRTVAGVDARGAGAARRRRPAHRPRGRADVDPDRAAHADGTSAESRSPRRGARRLAPAPVDQRSCATPSAIAGWSATRRCSARSALRRPRPASTAARGWRCRRSAARRRR